MKRDALLPINVLLRSVVIYYIKVGDRVAGEKLVMYGNYNRTREIKTESE